MIQAEPAARSRRFLPWRWALLLVLAVAVGMVALFWGKPKAPLPMRWVGYQTAADGTSIVGILTVTNQSRRTYSLQIIGPGPTCASQFLSKDSETNWVFWNPPKGPYTFFFDIAPGSGQRIVIALPQDGRTGQLLVWVGERAAPASKLTRWVRRILDRPGLSSAFFQTLEEHIQCPRPRPDGVLEPPRVLPNGHGE